MKKLLILVVMVFNFGCAASTYNKADYIQNLNMIDFGKYKVVLDKSFVPIGNLSGDVIQEGIDGPGSVETTRYLFADTSEGRDNIKRAICVYQYRITDRNQYVNVASYDYYKGRHIEKGRTKLDGVGDIAYLITPILSGISKDVLELGKSKGFQMDKNIRYGISIQFALVIGIQRMIEIVYIEGGNINYENNYDEVRRALSRADECITLIK